MGCPRQAQSEVSLLLLIKSARSDRVHPLASRWQKGTCQLHQQGYHGDIVQGVPAQEGTHAQDIEQICYWSH